MSDMVSRLLAAIQEREDRANAEGHHDPDEGGYYACPATRSEPYGDLPFGEENCDFRRGRMTPSKTEQRLVMVIMLTCLALVASSLPLMLCGLVTLATILLITGVVVASVLVYLMDRAIVRGIKKLRGSSHRTRRTR